MWFVCFAHLSNNDCLEDRKPFNYKILKTKNFWISAFDISAKKDFAKNNWKGKNVLLFGSEGFGIKAKTLENSDFRFKVNMNNNIESLNISNTVSVVCHHIFQSIK